MTSGNRRKRIATRQTDDGYRVTGQHRIYRSFAGAFNAAWKTCAAGGADLYAITPAGKWVLLLTGAAIRAYEQDRPAD